MFMGDRLMESLLYSKKFFTFIPSFGQKLMHLTLTQTFDIMHYIIRTNMMHKIKIQTIDKQSCEWRSDEIEAKIDLFQERYLPLKRLATIETY